MGSSESGSYTPHSATDALNTLHDESASKKLTVQSNQPFTEEQAAPLIETDPSTSLQRHPTLKQALQHERQQIAHEIIEARQRRNPINDKLNLDRQAIENLEQTLNDITAKQQTLQAQTERTKRLGERIKSLFNLRKSEESSLDTAELHTEEAAAIAAELEELSSSVQQTEATLEGLPNPQQLLDAYEISRQTEPLTNEEKRQLLTNDFLADLSTDEYLALWQKLNPHFVAHTTRNGVRDTFRSFHRGDLGVYVSGASSIFAQGNLQSRLAFRTGLMTSDKQSVANYLNNEGVFERETPEAAMEDLKYILNQQVAAAPRYPDEAAIHMSTGKVLDNLYGGEIHNQIFFVYPSDAIASQYNYSFNDPRGGFNTRELDEWNDMFVYPKGLDDVGIPINSGLTFIPKSTLVDPETGSAYALIPQERDGKQIQIPKPDQQLIDNFSTWINDAETIKRLLEIQQEDSPDWKLIEDFETSHRRYLQACQVSLAPLGLSKEMITMVAKELSSYQFRLKKVDSNQLISDIMSESNLLWQKAETTITTQAYWENYFSQHPEQRPNHIIYYDGDPTNAVQQLLNDNAIGLADTSKTDGNLLGFDDRNIDDDRTDPRAYPGYEETLAIAQEIITEHFQEQARQNNPVAI